MNERLVNYTFSISNPSDAVALTDLACYFMIPFGATLVYASVAPWDNDATATMDINDDGAEIVAAIDATDKDVPGEWISTHLGGAETPIQIAAGSEMTLDFNTATAANRFDVQIMVLSGETWG